MTTPLYNIIWVNKNDQSRRGRGTKSFSHDEAVALRDELNREYPHIEHTIDLDVKSIRNTPPAVVATI